MDCPELIAEFFSLAEYYRNVHCQMYVAMHIACAWASGRVQTLESKVEQQAIGTGHVVCGSGRWK